jgi:glycosyltransferase involved in cell wall biosynthesis
MKVFLPIYGECAHSLYRAMMENPPKNCEYITRKNKPGGLYNFYYSSDTSRKITNILYNLSSLLVSPTYLKAFMEKNENVYDADIVYAVANFYLGKLPWVIDCEDARSFYRGNEHLFMIHKHHIEKILSKPNCKKILPFTEKAKKSILLNYNIANIKSKIEVLPPTIKSTHINLNRNYKHIMFLFVGSSNIQFRKDFYFKGGLETIRAFQKISGAYDNVSLVIRSEVDERIREIIYKTKKIHLIEDILPRTKLEKLYASSSVFVYPTFGTPGMAFVEAMNYGLPIITTDYAANSEYVEDYYNGFLVDMPKTVKRKSVGAFKGITVYPRDMGYHKVDEGQIENICEKMRYFIDNPKEIQRMGKNSKKLVEKGKYSMRRRNQILKQIYEECLKK